MSDIEETTDSPVVTYQWAGCMSFEDVSTADEDEDAE
jgi:hypothetical protein